MKLNDITIKTPHSMPITKIKIANTITLASGKTVMDVKTRKRVLPCKYNAIREDDLQTILGIINVEDFFTVEFDDAGETATMTAYLNGDIKGEPRRTDADSVWIWEDVEFTLSEQ